VQRASIVGLLLVLMTAMWLFLPARESVDDTVNRHLRFSLEVKNITGRVVGEEQVVVSAPIDWGEKQKLISVKVGTDILASESNVDGIDLTLSLGSLAPYASKTILVDTVVEMRNRSREAGPQKQFLRSTDLIVIESPITQKYTSLYTDNHHSPESFSLWLSQNIEYAGYIAEARGSDYALSEMSGDCTEYSAALVAVLRGRGIPARIIAGMIVEEEKALVRSADYHNWVEYHDGKRWVALDPQFGRSAETPNYIVFHQVAESKAAPAQRFFSTTQGLSVRIL